MTKRFHRGLTAELRLRMRFSGLKLDEEDAQKILGGEYFTYDPDVIQWAARAKTDIFDPSAKQELMRQWESEHEGENPFPPSFAQRLQEVLNDSDPDSAAEAWGRIQMMIEKEVQKDNWYDGD